MKGSFKNCLSLSFILMAHLTGSAKTLSLSEDKTAPVCDSTCVSLTMPKYRRRHGILPKRLPPGSSTELDLRHTGSSVRFPQKESSFPRFVSSLQNHQISS